MTKKTSVTQSIRAASLLIITTIVTFGYQSIRQLAKQHNLSKSSVHRHLNAYQRRDQHPESPLWETEAGSEFLRRLCCYILLEEAVLDRSYDTWKACTCARLDDLGLTVKHAVSDRAKALIKLALKGWHCQAGADLFHAQYDLNRWLALPLSRATRHPPDG